MKKTLSFEFYQSKCEAARDAACAYGLNSKQYLDAVQEMQEVYKRTKLPFLYKVINLLTKLTWHKSKQRY